ncbi:MAG: hypothetical protein KJ941_13455 [Bacteroidetes bacterium]|nr:hypothetical protein [Bacteroidota bacterium]
MDDAVNRSHNIHCSLMDKTGNLWFGTTGDGVYRFDGETFTDFSEKADNVLAKLRFNAV